MIESVHKDQPPFSKTPSDRTSTHVEQDALNVDLDDMLVLVHLEPGRNGSRDDRGFGGGRHGRLTVVIIEFRWITEKPGERKQ
jgi:hypothetical protein